ncbi:MAG: hypothetical protein HWE27_11020 [Gammaproteobacteria bacterium]|nr:hypothetical protein [Gammaproteobacteria bacterium]
MKHFFILLIVISITACSTSRGFNRDYLRNSLNSHKKEITDEQIKKALETKAELPELFKLAIYAELNSWQVHWDENDKKELESLEQKLKESNVVSEVIFLNSSMFEGDGLAAIRLAAARTGSDAVLVIHGAGSSDRYNNFWGATYFLMITPFFIPGTVSDGLFMLNASLWDVRYQYLYLSAEAEAKASQTGTAFHLEDSHVLAEAKSKAVVLLRKEIEEQLLSMHKAHKNKKK